MGQPSNLQIINDAQELAKKGELTLEEIASRVDRSTTWLWKHGVRANRSATPSAVAPGLATGVSQDAGAQLAAWQQAFTGETSTKPSSHQTEDLASAASNGHSADPAAQRPSSTEPGETRAAAVQRMVRNRRLETDLTLATMRECPPELLKGFAKSRNRRLRLSTAKNPSTPEEALSSLAWPLERGDPEMLAALVVHPATPSSVLMKMIERCDDPKVLQVLASSPRVGRKGWVEGPVFGNKISDTRLEGGLNELVKHPDTHEALLDNPNVSEYLVRRMVRDTASTDTKVKALRHRLCDQETREAEASDPEPRVRAAVAPFANISDGVYRRLLADPEPRVRAAAARSSRLDDRKRDPYVQQLMGDPDPAVRASLAKFNERRSVVRELARDPDPAVREAAAGNRYVRRLPGRRR